MPIKHDTVTVGQWRRTDHRANDNRRAFMVVIGASYTTWLVDTYHNAQYTGRHRWTTDEVKSYYPIPIDHLSVACAIEATNFC